MNVMHQYQKELILDGSLGKLTKHCIWLLIDFLHIDMIHVPLGERIWLLVSRITIAISILVLRTIC